MNSKTVITPNNFLIASSSLEKIIGPTLYQYEAIQKLADRLLIKAELLHVSRRMDALNSVSETLLSLNLPKPYQAIARYYQSLCISDFGRGDLDRARANLEQVLREAPPAFLSRALVTMGAFAKDCSDYKSSLGFYKDAIRSASNGKFLDAQSVLAASKMIAVLYSIKGDHYQAIKLLEELFTLAKYLKKFRPHLFYDYLNSLAVELGEVGRIKEAKMYSQLALASPYAIAYPEWLDTYNDLALRGCSSNRCFVAVSYARVIEGDEHYPNEDRQESVVAVSNSNVARITGHRKPHETDSQPSPQGGGRKILEFPERISAMASKNSQKLERSISYQRPMTKYELREELIHLAGTKNYTEEEMIQAIEFLKSLGNEQNTAKK